MERTITLSETIHPLRRANLNERGKICKPFYFKPLLPNLAKGTSFLPFELLVINHKCSNFSSLNSFFQCQNSDDFKMKKVPWYERLCWRTYTTIQDSPYHLLEASNFKYLFSRQFWFWLKLLALDFSIYTRHLWKWLFCFHERCLLPQKVHAVAKW